MVRPARLELATLCLEGKRRYVKWLVRLVFSYVLHHGLACYSAVFVPKLCLSFWGEPLIWHNFFGHSFRF